MRHALAHCFGGTDTSPAAITITAHGEDGIMSDTYSTGQTIYLTAQALNAENGTLQDAPGSWTSTQGTITADATNPDQATLVGVPVGDCTVTFTASNGVAGSLDITVVDNTVTSVTVTSSATAPADETAAAPATDATAA